MESASSYPCDRTVSGEEATAKSDDVDKSPCDTVESFKHELVNSRNRQTYEYDEYHRGLETLDEQDQAEENILLLTTSNELNENQMIS